MYTVYSYNKYILFLFVFEPMPVFIHSAQAEFIGLVCSLCCFTCYVLHCISFVYMYRIL